MKSKGVFILIGVFLAVCAVMYFLGASSESIIFLSGPVMIIIGVLLLIKEMNWRRDSEVVPGKVTQYFEYTRNERTVNDGLNRMFTMEAEYTTTDGKLIRSREQSGSSIKKYAEGAAIEVRYSRENPGLFIVKGDNSRIFAILAVLGMGVAIIFIFGSILMQGGS